jgi:hypothetical protein
MGDFRMTIEAAGGHGCDRTAKEGGELRGCGQENCPDCMFARFVSDMQRAGMRPFKATMHHWPADLIRPDGTHAGYAADREVVDDYTEKDVKYPGGAFRRSSGKRTKGSF